MIAIDSTGKKEIAWILVAAFALMALVCAAGFWLFPDDSPDSIESGLFKSDAQTAAETKPEKETAEDRQNEYESREEMPSVVEENFYQTIRQYLSSGRFSSLDAQLYDWQTKYKDSTDESESKSAVIAHYRGDIAYYKNISDKKGASEIWAFKSADVLAAAVAYSSINAKYQAFIDQTSVVFPAVSEGVNIRLAASGKTGEELFAMKDDINRLRNEGSEFLQIKVYTMDLFGYSCEFIAVMDTASMSWMPYSLQTVDNTVQDLPTVSLAKQIASGDPSVNLDTVIAVPAAISETANLSGKQA